MFQGNFVGGSAEKRIFSPVPGWVKDIVADQSAMSHPSSRVLYFLSPTSGREREENWQRI